MSGLNQWARLGLIAVAAAAGSASAMAASPNSEVITAIELSQPFETRSAWSFIASQGPSVDDPVGWSGDKVPGVVHICLRKGDPDPCDPHLQSTLRTISDDDLFSDPHYLNKAQIVRAHGASGRPFLLVEIASVHAIDGDQVVLLQALVYQRRSDQFIRAYEHITGTNNNQEVRYVTSGPLEGDIISVEPTEDAPFGFWVSVNAFTPADTYKEVLHYRSATMYGDGNPLAVIDSEMPNIERRLGLWHVGLPLPVPATSCPKPHMTRMELWCG